MPFSLTRLSWRRLFSSAFLVACVLGLIASGYAHVPLAEVTSFSEATGATRQQAEEAFRGVNDLVLEAQVEHAVSLPTLNEDAVPGALSQEDVHRWMNAFSEIEAYAQNLSGLLSAAPKEATESSLVSLGSYLQQAAPGSFPHPAIAAAFTKLASVLVELHGQKKARDLIRQTDPAVQDLFGTMAEVLGAGPDQGVRLTVRGAWATSMGSLQVEFLEERDPRAKRALVRRYVDQIRRRNAQDQTLASLRQSLLDLAHAHAALAGPHPRRAGAILTLIRNELNGTRQLLEQFRRSGSGEGEP